MLRLPSVMRLLPRRNLLGPTPSIALASRSGSSVKPTSRMFSTTSIVVGGLGATVGLLLFVRTRRLQDNAKILPHAFNEQQQVRTLLPTDPEELRKCDFVLYRFQDCPYCCRTAGFLDHYGLKYSTVEVNRMSKGEVKEHGYSKVPQLRVITPSGHSFLIVDSEEIFNALSQVLSPPDELLSSELHKWRSWTQGKLMRHVLLGIYGSPATALSSVIESGMEPTERALRALSIPVMLFVCSSVRNKLKDVYATQLFEGEPAYDPSDEPAALQRALSFWVKTGLKGQRFHGGEKPDIVDADVYGVLQSACREGVLARARAKDSVLDTWMENMRIFKQQ